MTIRRHSGAVEGFAPKCSSSSWVWGFGVCQGALPTSGTSAQESQVGLGIRRRLLCGDFDHEFAGAHCASAWRVARHQVTCPRAGSGRLTLDAGRVSGPGPLQTFRLQALNGQGDQCSECVQVARISLKLLSILINCPNSRPSPRKTKALQPSPRSASLLS